MTQYTKYLKISKMAAMFEIELDRATGVPIPSEQILDRHFIVGRELRVFLFEENRGVYLGNCLNLKAKWSQNYEDRIYFDTYDIDKEEQIIVKVPAADLGSKDKRVSLMFELVMFVKRNDSRHANVMTAGFCKLDLLTVDSGKTFHLDLVSGSPQKDKTFNIAPGEVMHRRKGFMPTLASLFEGKIKSQLHLSVKPFKFNPSSPTEFAEQVELLPDLGVYHTPQIKIHSYFRQCLGRDAFSFRGAVTSNLNLHLSTEIYVNSYCFWFCIPSMAVMLSHFWNNTVQPYFAKDRYELKMDALKYIFVSLYAPLNSKDFAFEKLAPTNDFYGDEAKAKERLQILRTELERVWMDVQMLSRDKPGQKMVPVKHLETVAKLEQRTAETTYSAFNLQELMDDDFGS